MINTLVQDPHAAPMTAAADTVQTVLSHASDGHGEGFDFASILHHVNDSAELETPFGALHLPQFPPVEIAGFTIDLSVTKHVFFLVLSALILLAAVVVVARRARKNPVPSGFSNLVELLIVFVRDEIAVANMGQTGLRYLPYLLSTFFLILIMNLFGLFPYGATPTGNIAVTAGLAIIAFVMIQISSIRAQGFSAYISHLTGGTSVWLWPIMIPIEVVGLFTKPFALCMRLFANMTGGHIVILALLGFIFFAQSFFVAPIPVLFVVGIYMLELLVAFIQAYIFTMLAALFMGLGMVHEEGAEGEH